MKMVSAIDAHTDASKEEESWYRVSNISEIDSPAFVVYPGRVKKNIALANTMINDPSRLRPHIKTHKTREVAQMLMQAGITKFKCATIAEAELLAITHAADVLLAYQPVGPKLNRFISLVQQYPATKFSCLVDNYAVAAQISQAALEAEITIRVFIDVNVGMNRTGIHSEDAVALYEDCLNLNGIKPVGLHAYDGQIHDADFTIRKEQAAAVINSIETIRKKISAKNISEPIIVVGGSPTFPIYAAEENIECSPGTFVFWDASYKDAFLEQPFLIAALLVTRVISLPNETTICTDLGHKSVAAENSLDKRIQFLNAPGLKPVGQSEEHLKLETAKGHSYKIGDVLYAIPYHVCPTCALYERAIVIENGKASGEWKIIGRDRKINC
jgi:D-serine deaminase-like pyridoxal phosphate-dependent protein